MTAYEVVTGRVTNPGAAFTALTANTGNTFNVRDFPDTDVAVLEGMWTQAATGGELRVRSPRLHDDTQGIRLRSIAASVRNLFPDDLTQRLHPNDPLRVEMTGGGAEVDAAALLIYYRNLGGITQRVETWESIKSRIVDVVGHAVAVAGPATSGDWSAGTLITVTSDVLKADTQYAILGYSVDAEVLAVGISGTDTGNLRVGGPGPVEGIETRDWFISLSKALGTPHIPVFNSNNRGNTLVSVARITAAGTVNVNLILARLSG